MEYNRILKNFRCLYFYGKSIYLTVISMTAQDEENGQENKLRLLLYIMLPIALVIILLAFVTLYLRRKKSTGNFNQF